MGIGLVGVSHETAPIEVRERFHVARRGVGETLERLLRGPAVSECVVLSTCNRTEAYVAGEETGSALAAAEGALARGSGLTRSEAAPYLYRRRGRDTATHLFRVVAGLDSMVVGEPQIQGQVSDAYEAARELAPDAVGPVMHRLFQTALSAGGEVRERTRIGEGAASVPSAAVRLVEKVFGELEGRRAMVVGAGEMGEQTLSALGAHGVSEMLVASRTVERAREAAERVGAEPVGFERFWELLPGLDVVVTSTSAPHPLVTEERFLASGAPAGDALVVVDIAVPRDVEPEVGELPGVFLYNIDDLQEVVRTTEARRESERGDADALLEASADDFWSWYCSREAVPLIRRIRGQAEQVREEELEAVLSEIEALDPEDRERIHRASRLVLKKVLHAPTVGLRQMAADEEGAELLEAARRLFGLGDGDEGGAPET